MSNHGLEILNRNVQLAHEWIDELDDVLGWDDKHRSYRLLRVTMQALRDCLPAVEAADFAAQLPTLLRGVFYEHWRPGAKKRRCDVDHFLARIQEEFRDDPIEDVADSVGVVLGLFSEKISEGEIVQVQQCLSETVRSLWP